MLNIFACHKEQMNRLPDHLYNNLKKWEKLNPHFILEYSSLKDQKQYLSKSLYCKKYTNCISSYSIQSDPNHISNVFKYVKLIEHGGIWIDLHVNAIDLLKTCITRSMLLKEKTILFFQQDRFYPFILGINRQNQVSKYLFSTKYLPLGLRHVSLDSHFFKFVHNWSISYQKIECKHLNMPLF